MPGGAKYIALADGPNGVGNGSTGVTAFPAAVNGAATFDPGLMRRYGRAVGAEQTGKGHNVALAPTINILRDPRWGRAFETFSEDPLLTARMAAGQVKGIQSEGVIATPKHFAANNQETDRGTVNVEVSERALNEIYYPGFRATVSEGGAQAVMCAYPKVNGTYACENSELLSALKDAWRFAGFVVSDWGATHSTVPSAKAGLDMEMPGATYFGAALKSAVESGAVSVRTIDDKVRRILTAMYRVGVFDRDYPPSDDVSTAEHRRLARELAEQGMVLLKNDRHALPADRARSIAVIGDAAGEHATFYGGGSAAVRPSATVTPLQGIKERAGDRVTVHEAVAAARRSDLAVVFVNDSISEGSDRRSLALPGDQDRLIKAVAAANPRTVVVINTGAASLMPWLKDVAAVVQAWYPGQEYGHAIASVLFGDVNPSGRLPVTFPASDAQGQGNFPGDGTTVRYEEGILVGYRWYDATRTQPLFPFGYGLSYTRFRYDHAHTRGHTVQVRVTNTGHRAGAETVQLYLQFPSSTGEPPRQLKGFQKVTLKPGQSTRVTFHLNHQDLSTWQNGWKPAHGTFTARIGPSSRTIQVAGRFRN